MSDGITEMMKRVSEHNAPAEIIRAVKAWNKPDLYMDSKTNRLQSIIEKGIKSHKRSR